jgi:hypothetical protein
VIADACSEYISPSAAVINEWYGRAGTPVGALRLPDNGENPAYQRYKGQVRLFEERFPDRLYNRFLPVGTRYASKKAADFPGTTEVYRRVLAAAEDGAVVICVVGFMTALRQLLESGPDDITALAGEELVRRKVSHVVAMAVVSPCPGKGDGNFNFQMDLPASRFVVECLPVPLHLSCWGTSITTGERFMAAASLQHPGRKAYERYLRDDRLTPPEWNRSSWDQVAALYAVMGEGEFFDVKRGYTLTTASDQDFEWRSGGSRADGYVIPRSEKELERLIEDWMIGGREGEHSVVGRRGGFSDPY